MNNIKKISLNKKLSKIDEDYTHIIDNQTLEKYKNGIVNLIKTTLYFNNDEQIAKIENINNMIDFYYNKNNILYKIELVGNVVLNILNQENKYKNHPFENASSYYIYKSEFYNESEISHGIFLDDRYNILGTFKYQLNNYSNHNVTQINYMNISGEKIADFQEVLINPELNDGWNLIGQINYDSALLQSFNGLIFTFEDFRYQQLNTNGSSYINLPRGKCVWLRKNA